MGGRKVCFIGNDGQIGTCIRDDGNCVKCDLATMQKHFVWQKSEQELQREMSSGYYDKIFEKLIAIEKVACEIRGISIVVHNLGYPKLYKSLDLKLNYIHELIRDVEKLSIEQMHKQTEEAEYDTQRLKLVLKRMD